MRRILLIVLAVPCAVLSVLTLIKAPEISSIEEQLQQESEVEQAPELENTEVDFGDGKKVAEAVETKISPYLEVAGKNVAVPKPKPIVIPSGNYGGRVLAIGDSVMLGATSALRSVIPGIYVDAAGSRGADAAAGIIASYKARGTAADVYVIGLITNYRAISAATWQNVVNAGGADKKYILVTGYCGNSLCGDPLTNRATQNNSIYNFAATHSNVYVADWWSYVKDNPGAYFYEDHTHLAPNGRTAYAALIKRVLMSL